MLLSCGFDEYSAPLAFCWWWAAFIAAVEERAAFLAYRSIAWVVYFASQGVRDR